MKVYLRNLLVYFENALHPAGSSSESSFEKRKRKARTGGSRFQSPESYNIRGGVVKKQEKLRRNPAP